MKQRLRSRNRLSIRMRNRLRHSAVIFTFGMLLSGIFFLYHFIGNVSDSRAQQIKERENPPIGILEGFSGRKKIHIHSEKLPFNREIQNFPVLVNLRLDELKSISNADTTDCAICQVDPKANHSCRRCLRSCHLQEVSCFSPIELTSAIVY